MQQTFGSTCHGAGRSRSRNNSRNSLTYTQVLDNLKTKGIAIRCGTSNMRTPQLLSLPITSLPYELRCHILLVSAICRRAPDFCTE